MLKAITIAIFATTMYYYMPIFMCELETTPCYVQAYLDRHETHETPTQAHDRCEIESFGKYAQLHKK